MRLLKKFLDWILSMFKKKKKTKKTKKLYRVIDKNKITKSLLRKNYIYRNGKLFHRRSRQAVTDMSKPAGHLRKSPKPRVNYRVWVLTVYGNTIDRSRAVWIYHNGRPKYGKKVFRKNKKMTDDRIENLYLK